MEVLLPALLSGVVGTAAGGVLCVLLRRVTDVLLSRLMHLTAGLMLAVVCFELLPEAMALSVPYTVLGLILGMALMLVTEASSLGSGASPAIKTGLLVGFGIALHNLPEGLAVGAGYADAPTLGLALCVTIALHDVPEGMAMALPLRDGGMRRARVVLMTVLAGLPTMLGAGIGLFVGGVSHEALAICLSLAGGAMLQATCAGVLPEAQKRAAGTTESLMLVLGTALGAVICLLI